MERHRTSSEALPPVSHASASKELVVLVIGVVGAGKSTFVNAALGRNAAKVSHGFTIGSPDITKYTMNVDGFRIALLDTPGFGSPEHDDNAILTKIIEGIEKTCSLDSDCIGIVHLHDISRPRVNLSRTMLSRLVKRPLLLSRLLFVTGNAGRTPDLDIEILQKQLEVHWRTLAGEKASIQHHFEPGSDSARHILRSLMHSEGFLTTGDLVKELAVVKGDSASDSKRSIWARVLRFSN